jgi:predicted RNA methylase
MNPPSSFVTNAIRRGARVHDSLFDRIYPPSVQLVSGRFWTPVDVALTAAGWLAEFGAARVLDVGSGVGKFCIVASLASDRTVTGIEQRSHLVETARAAAARYDAPVECMQGTLESVDATRFDAFYFFNPFGENLYHLDEHLDATVELSEQRCHQDLATVERWLDLAPLRTCVVTYHGFGGRIPSTYHLVRSAPMATDELHLWMKRRSGRASGFFVELEGVVLSSRQLEAVSDRLATDESRSRMRALLDRPLS